MKRVLRTFTAAKIVAGLALATAAFAALRLKNIAPPTSRADASTRMQLVAQSAEDKLWREVSPGVRLRVLSARDGISTARVTALRFAPSRFHVATGAMLDASQWRAKTGSIAATNGGFFDAGGKSMGLRASNNKRLSTLRRADWGVFVVTKSGARIVHTRDYEALRNRERVLEAVQCGPRLVVNGSVTKLKPQLARRTGLGIVRNGSVILAVADDAMTFSGWAQMWASKSGLNCRDALNLDGGGSTQMALQSRRENFFISGNRAVPDAIVAR